MATRPIVRRATEGNWLKVLGMQLRFLCTSDDTQGQYSSLLNTVPKGLGAPPHQHPWDEAFYVLAGEVEFMLDRERHVITMGDYVLAPANTPHAFTGISDEESLLIAFESPGHSHRFFQEINDIIRSIPNDLDKLPDIGQRHQVTFLTGTDKLTSEGG